MAGVECSSKWKVILSFGSACFVGGNSLKGLGPLLRQPHERPARQAEVAAPLAQQTVPL